MMSDSDKKEKQDKFKLRVAGQPALEPPKPRPLPAEHPASLLFVGERPGERGEDKTEPIISPASLPQSDERPEETTKLAQPATTENLSRPSRRPAPPPKAPASFEEFTERWSVYLKSGERTGKLKICEIIFKNTHAIGKNSFFTSYDKLATLCGMGKATTVKNIKQLEAIGFVERLKIYNTASRKGTELRLHLERLSPTERRQPIIIHFDNE